MGFYDRYYDKYATQQQQEQRKAERLSREREEKRQAETDALPRMPVTVHTCLRTSRYKTLRGLAAVVIDVRLENGDPCYRLPYEAYHAYEMYLKPPAMETWEEWFEDYYTKLQERHQFTWLRAMHNPNIAFICDGKAASTHNNRLAPREIMAVYFIKVMEKLGYTVTPA